MERSVKIIKILDEDEVLVTFTAVKHEKVFSKIKKEDIEVSSVTVLETKGYNIDDSAFIKDAVLWIRQAKLPDKEE